jgi:hypothetical protein
MSYSEFLNRKKINSPNIVDNRMKFSDASSYIWRTRLGAASVSRPTDHVITNVNDPSVVPTLNSKKPNVYKGTGFGGKVMDASDFIATRGASAIGKDSFGPVKTNIGSKGTCLAFAPASQVVDSNGNADGKGTGLNMGYQDTCAVFTPQTKSYFVDTIPAIKTGKVGVVAKSGATKGIQNALPNCKTTSTTGAAMNADGSLGAKDEKTLNLHPVGPEKTDFLTAILGPQVSSNGRGVRAPKVGGAIERPKYSERHHGRAWGPRPFPAAFNPPNNAPAQLKINSPQHYFVA